MMTQYKVPKCLKLPVGKIPRSARVIEVPEKECVGYCMTDASQLTYISDYITEGSTVQCCPGYLLRPEKYYVLGVEYNRSVHHFLKNLSDFYDAEEKTKPRQLEKRVPKREEVTVGCVFVVRENVENTWHRCKIIKIISETEYQVILLENGMTLTIECSQLRYINQEFINFPVHTVLIRVSDEEIQSKVNFEEKIVTKDDWMREMFEGVIAYHLFLVTFKHREMDSEGCFVWKAEVSVISQVDLSLVWKNAFFELQNRILLYNKK